MKKRPFDTEPVAVSERSRDAHDAAEHVLTPRTIRSARRLAAMRNAPSVRALIGDDPHADVVG